MTLLGTILAAVLAAALFGFSLYRSACRLADKADPILALVKSMHEALTSTHESGFPWLKTLVKRLFVSSFAGLLTHVLLPPLRSFSPFLKGFFNYWYSGTLPLGIALVTFLVSKKLPVP